MSLFIASPESSEFVQALALVDLVGFGLVGLMLAFGVWRGLWWQVIRLLAVALAVAAARTWHEGLGVQLTARWAEVEPRVANGAAWLLVFLITLGVVTLFGKIGNRILEAAHLGLVNRAAGGLVGGLTGLALHLTALVAICQLAPEDFLSRHVSGTWSEGLIRAAAVERPLALKEASSAALEGTMDEARERLEESTPRRREESETPPTGPLDVEEEDAPEVPNRGVVR